ncbi:MAG: cytochrome c biogenesis protein CcdA, partial [Pseudomonadota bacterium]
QDHDTLIDYSITPLLQQFNQKLIRYVQKPLSFDLLRHADTHENKFQLQIPKALFPDIDVARPNLDVIAITPLGWAFDKPLIKVADQSINVDLMINQKPQKDLDILDQEFGWLITYQPVNKDVMNGFQFKKAPLKASFLEREINVLDQYKWLSILIFAFLGGLILNLMPCVLPVLSLKLLNLVKANANRDRRVIRKNFMASMVGVFATFMVLAFIVIILQMNGRYAGWGIHFQHPVIVYIIFVTLLVFAASMMGWFTIDLPRFLKDKMSLLLTKGSNNHQQNHVGISFFEGVFATLLATPCTAPFLGTAISFAFSTDVYWHVFIIFVALAAGMAFPYMMIILRPSFIDFLPKPGPW